jgi:hypothetical protein
LPSMSSGVVRCSAFACLSVTARTVWPGTCLTEVPGFLSCRGFRRATCNSTVHHCRRAASTVNTKGGQVRLLASTTVNRGGTSRARSDRPSAMGSPSGDPSGPSANLWRHCWPQSMPPPVGIVRTASVQRLSRRHGRLTTHTFPANALVGCDPHRHAVGSGIRQPRTGNLIECTDQP